MSIPEGPRHRRARRRRWPFLLGVLLIPVVLLQQFTRDDGPRGAFTRWTDGTVHGPWRSVFDGHGLNGIRDGVISMRPMPPTRPDETHAGLIVSAASHTGLDFRLETRTTEALRKPRGNPWEVSWVVWAYTDPEHFYYLALKPNGWELGKRDPAYPGGQRFLATGHRAFPLGEWYSVKIEQRDATLKVHAEGDELTAFTDRERPYPSGSVGMYTEDAAVEFRDIEIGG
ncbi:hypothetical protein GCM10010439_01550 [Actinocorallia aurantiaca]|uniref:3-keto-alpha-glucoside-1,2-lyase/3-keto-2-hydroxy-glucal hydratase domain-containing protein n=1 Tax=Actinocorallia aurantiaca TaxID=46204 RepID=A0ABP6G8A3_9ACTN